MPPAALSRRPTGSETKGATGDIPCGKRAATTMKRKVGDTTLPPSKYESDEPQRPEIRPRTRDQTREADRRTIWPTRATEWRTDGAYEAFPMAVLVVCEQTEKDLGEKGKSTRTADIVTDLVRELL